MLVHVRVHINGTGIDFRYDTKKTFLRGEVVPSTTDPQVWAETSPSSSFDQNRTDIKITHMELKPGVLIREPQSSTVPDMLTRLVASGKHTKVLIVGMCSPV